MVVVVESTNSVVEVGSPSKHQLLYGVDSVPPWSVTIFLCCQQFAAMFISIVTVPFVIAPALCVPSDHPVRGYLLSTMVFVSGLVSFLQATFGMRLPIMQGPSASFYAPILAIMALPQWHCPFDVASPGIPANYTDGVWQSRIVEIQGAVIVSSMVPVILSITGAITILKRYITPLVVTPTIAVIGLSLFRSSVQLACGNWAISMSTLILLVGFSQYLTNVMVPFPAYRRDKGCHLSPMRWFCFFPIISTVAIMWLVCYVLTIYDVLPAANLGRTDLKTDVIVHSDWVRFPYPLQWGMPTVTLASVLGMTAAVLTTIIESIGDYFTCASMCSVPAPPVHAVNRGILFEGMSCCLAGLWGAGVGTTSYADNIGTIGITKVGSIRIVQLTSGLMMLAAIFTKFTAVFATLPDPVIGGVYLFQFAMVLAVGLSNIQFVDLRATRNIFVLGFSIFFGFAVSNYVSDNPGIIKTGNETADQVFTVVISTSMLMAGLLGFFLDNTIPGTKEERGVNHWNPTGSSEDSGTADLVANADIYEFPFGCMPCIRKMSFLRYVPVCPTYVPIRCCTCRSRDRKKEQFKLTDSATEADNSAYEMESKF